MLFWLVAVIILAFGFVLLWGAPYLPTKRRQVAVALELLNVKEGSVIVDLGSGDGVFVLAAAKRGATVYGYELNPILFAISWLRCLPYRQHVHLQLANFWNVALPTETTGVYTFLLTRFMKRLDAKLVAEVVRLKHPIKLASFTFAIPGKQALEAQEGVFLYRYEP